MNPTRDIAGLRGAVEEEAVLTTGECVSRHCAEVVAQLIILLERGEVARSVIVYR